LNRLLGGALIIASSITSIRSFLPARANCGDLYKAARKYFCAPAAGIAFPSEMNDCHIARAGMSIAAPQAPAALCRSSSKKGDVMNRLLCAMIAGAMSLSSGVLLAADPAGAGRDDSSHPDASQTTPGERTPAESQAGEVKPNPATAQARSAKDNPRDPRAVYSAELKKCDSLRGSKKQECIAAAKKKAGEM